jgi:hypothetical protein
LESFYSYIELTKLNYSAYEISIRRSSVFVWDWGMCAAIFIWKVFKYVNVDHSGAEGTAAPRISTRLMMVEYVETGSAVMNF